MACQSPGELGLPLSRLHVPDIRSEVLRRGLVAAISETTIWRWLHEDAIRPWTHRSWIFPRDPDFERRAGPVLDLYGRSWQGGQLREDEYVICADEKPGIQLRRRCHPSLPAASGRPALVEHGYTRHGTLAYLAAWDCHRAKVIGRCESQTGIEPFGRLVAQVMETEPYASARRVFWIVDNGPSHRGQNATTRMTALWPKAQMVHTPLHSSWLNQVEIFFSIVHRKVLTPDDYPDPIALAERLHRFEQVYEQTARPFEWKFTRADLSSLMRRIAERELAHAA